MEMKYFERPAILLNRDYFNKGGLDLAGWRLKKNSADWPIAGKAGSNLADRQNSFLTSNFVSP